MILVRRLFLLLVVLCAGGVMALPKGATAQDPAATPAATPTPLRWAPCDDVPDTECAGLAVPVDPANPTGPKFTLRLGRVPASDPAHRKGVLLFIPGGPGAGIAMTLGGENRIVQHINDFRRSYDVVSFDPRGIGESSPIRCDPALVPPATAPQVQPPTAAQLAAIAHTNATFFQSCFAATGELMAHLSAQDTAADVEQLRQALGLQDGLVAYAGSYGSAYAAAYLERYGDHVKMLVLDAVVDHSVDLPTYMERNVLSVQDSFDRFQQWCSQYTTCALHGQDLGAVFDADVARAPAVRTLVPQLLAAGSDPQFGWPMVAKMLAEVHSGNTATLDALTGSAALGSTSTDPWVRAGKNGLFAGVFCADFGPQVDYTVLAADAASLAAQVPRFAWKFWDSTPLAHGSAGVGDCLGWPMGATNPPHVLQVGAHPNVLVANPTHDPATPLSNALAVWLQIPRARLLIADADGHQSLIVSQCAYETQARFLADPTSVQSTTLCPA